MGIPAFFKWLSNKYPCIIVPCNEENLTGGNSSNPNGVEFDNLYLDMNGIIHSCCHPKKKLAPKDEEEMAIAIFEYIDRIFNVVRPRRLLYMAIDGVAPRAKMNEQRSRKWRRRKWMEANEKPKEEPFDKNCITPGTEFMTYLTQCLHYYIQDRLNSDPGWRDIEVILSGPNVPGEGEHKIMDFIRRQGSNSENDSNTRHCLYGTDADLVLLGLATHEPYFTIIREKPKTKRDTNSEPYGKFIFIKLFVLRECLAKELTMENLPFQFDLEKALDDWIFLCTFLGNDYLPNLLLLEISEGAIERLMELYKKVVYKTDGFLTENGTIELSRVQLIMKGLAKVEGEILKTRQDLQMTFWKERKKRMRSGSAATNSATSGGIKRKHEEIEDKSYPKMSRKKLKLWNNQFKKTFYQQKFNVDGEDRTFRHKVAKDYLEGLCWIMQYYYKGLPSWSWYFPHHYAPFASDFVNIEDIQIEFVKGKPFKPLVQLMAVLPPASKNLVPKSWRKLMVDPTSPIIEFYNTDVKIDMNGKKIPFQGIVLLPFVQPKKLIRTLLAYYPKLTKAERKRNVQGKDRLYIRHGHSGYDFVTALYGNISNRKRDIPINPKLFLGMGGSVMLPKNFVSPVVEVRSPLPSLPDIEQNAAVWVYFLNPQCSAE